MAKIEKSKLDDECNEMAADFNFGPCPWKQVDLNEDNRLKTFYCDLYIHMEIICRMTCFDGVNFSPTSAKTLFL